MTFFLTTKKTILSLILIFLTFSVYAQNTPEGETATETTAVEEAVAKQELFFIAPLAEVVGYSHDSIAYGGGIAIGTGSGTAIGLQFLYFTDPGNFIFMELLIFLRFYFFGPQASTGPYVQFIGGPVIYADTNPSPSGYGNFSAGLSAGWRIPLGTRFYIEPALRAGYPYIIGGGVSAGFRF